MLIKTLKKTTLWLKHNITKTKGKLIGVSQRTSSATMNRKIFIV
jgi:hypothetical protein